MKRNLLFVSALAISLLFVSFANAQKNPFSGKIKSAAAPTFAPQPVQVQALLSNPTINARLQQAGRYHPGSIPYSSLQTGITKYSDKQYGNYGQLIYVKGKLPHAIKLNMKSTAVVQEACFEYLNALKEMLRIQDAGKEFVIKSLETDNIGMNHIKMQQVYKGIPVYYGEVYLHSEDNQIALFNGNTLPTPSVAINPAIGAQQANLKAIIDVSGRTRFHVLTQTEKTLLDYDEPKSELVIYHKNRDPLQGKLAWHVTVRPNFIERWEYFIDAGTSDIIHFYNNTQTDGNVPASGTDLNGVNQNFHAYLEAGTYYLIDVSRPMFNAQNMEGTLRVFDANYTCPWAQNFSASVVSSSNNTWGPKAVSAQNHQGLAYDYYRTVHNRNSYNNQGGSIYSVINCTEENGSGLDNAFWNGKFVSYGNGNQLYKPLAGALDVSAHEVGHAYDETSANLEYQGQSGAINETYADISGAMVERKNWQLAEDIIPAGSSTFPTGAMRDMSNPHNGGTSLNDPGFQPAHVSEMYTGEQDHGGVHINSGIGNHAYYLFATAVGLEKGEQVFFRALFNYLTKSSQFIDFRLAVLQSAKDLYGDGSAEVTAAGNAFDQVGITTGSGGNYQNQLQVNPGQDYIMCYDLVESDPYTLYVSSTAGTDFVGISQTNLVNKPSLVDDGSVGLFVSSDNRLRMITISTTPEEQIIQTDPYWQNVAVSKDGSKMACISKYQDSSIYVYSFQKQEWATIHLYNPTTGQGGVGTNNVLYADALEWDYTGEYIMYDAYNQVNSSTGQNMDYWDINFVNVWNNAANNWGTGDVFKMVSGLPEGISIGNPSFSKNSPNIAAFDFFDASTGNVTVYAINLETGDAGEIYQNGTTLSYPNYSKLDNQLIFTTLYNSELIIAQIGLATNKIQPAGQAAGLIGNAQWGIWFAQGTRPLLDIQENKAALDVRLYPNPSHGMVTLLLDKKYKGSYAIEIVDMQGHRILTDEINANPGSVTLDLSSLHSGLYFIRITGDGFTVNRKIVLK